jgi:hypothetical protein
VRTLEFFSSHFDDLGPFFLKKRKVLWIIGYFTCFCRQDATIRKKNETLMRSLGMQGCNIYSHKQQRECSGATRRNAQPRDGGKRVAPEEMPGDSQGSIHRICALTETLRVCCSQTFSLVSKTRPRKILLLRPSIPLLQRERNLA